MTRNNGQGGWHWMVLTAVLLASGCAGMLPVEPLPDNYYFWQVHTQDRSDADRVIDQRRQPEKLLSFYAVRPGMRVLDLGAGGGYNTELLARVVGPKGVVYAQNNRYFLDNFVKGRFDERLKKPEMSNVVHAVREFDDPVPPQARDLDLVTFNFVYHDTAWLGTDRMKMNRAVFAALKPGGVYIVVDHSGRPGTGISEAKTLHRIDEGVVRKEVEAAGFKLIAEAGFLRNAGDPRDASVFKPKIPNDEFVLKFIKPKGG
ncbi:MAG: methyltransferase domain-containing protein [Burkholderiales bacterium]|nr:methyltransferase domain-containing protein [Burkholderiales bacterium]